MRRRKLLAGLTAYFSVLGSQLTLGCHAPATVSKRAKDSPQVTIFAASSTQDALRLVQQQLKREHPQLRLRLQFAGSQALRLQIEQGASADLFISANQDHVRALQHAGWIQETKRLTQNRLALIVPEKNPAQIQSIHDLPRASRLVVGLSQVPVGHYSDQLLEKAARVIAPEFTQNVRRSVVSRESNVRLIRSKVQMGAADAAFVYKSDLHGVQNLIEIPIPAQLQVKCDYWIAKIRQNTDPVKTSQVMDFLLSPAGQKSFNEVGFGMEQMQ